jgi:hypothetical protein
VECKRAGHPPAAKAGSKWRSNDRLELPLSSFTEYYQRRREQAAMTKIEEISVKEVQIK